MKDLFSQFADQFKPKEEPKKEVKREPIQEHIAVKEDRLVDRYEAYRKSHSEYISVKDFELLEQREQAVESLETMSEFDKKQRRLADKSKGIVSQTLEHLIAHDKLNPDLVSHPPMSVTMASIIQREEEQKSQQLKPSRYEKHIEDNGDTVYELKEVELTAADKFLAGRKEPKVFQSWDGEKVVESNEAPPPVTITITKDNHFVSDPEYSPIPNNFDLSISKDSPLYTGKGNYSGMPPGLKELQKLNWVNDHELQKKALEDSSRKNIVEGYIGMGSVFNSELEVEPLPEKEVQWEDFEEPITKEKKVRVFKKDFPTPERTQTVKQRSFVGIDNGVSGSVGIIYEDGTYEFFVTPVKKEQDYTKAKKLINRVQPLELADLFKYVGEGSMVMIERPMINSTRFNASMSAIRCFEATITILETLGLPYQVEDSKAWQKALLPIGITGDDLKKASKDVGNRLFPNTKLILHPDCDGMLIASYCKTQHR